MIESTRWGLWLSVLAVVACGEPAASPAEAPAGDECAAAIEALSACYPDLAEQATCAADSVGQFQRLDTSDCAGIEARGKADLFAFSGCDADQRVCGHIFCCDPYTLGWAPSGEADWDIVETVRAFQAAAPTEDRAAVESASPEALRQVVSSHWLQDVAETVDGTPRPMAVHLTRGLFDVPYERFVRALPTDEWGVALAHYLGGDVKIYGSDEQGRVVRQVERMVLSPLPFDYESPLSNNDMTKVEVIRYGAESATVYWRVMYSDNGSTETDVGSVDFRAAPGGGTWVTFHSAHRLNAPGRVHLPNRLIAPALSMTFRDFVQGYAARLGAAR